MAKDVSAVIALFFLVVILLIAVLAPLFGRDTSAGRWSDYPDERGWWPGGPDGRPRPRY
jgi:N-terminal TM domain of oligopeptide transport permease C